MNTKLKSDSIITEISQKESQIISVIRIVAMMFIVLCHYVQWFDNIRFLGEVFNVGTTMFFVLSGFLYGQKDVKNIWDWYKNRIIKIVTPLYVYYILTGVVLYLINKLGDISVYNLIKQLFNLNGFIGGGIGNIQTGHLWFISYILFCYLITPILQYIREKFKLKQILMFFILLTLCEMITIVNIKPSGFIVNISGVIIYISAYFVGAYWKKSIEIKKYIFLTIVMIFSMILRLGIKSIADMNMGIISIIYDRIIAGYTQGILAYWIFFTIYKIMSKFRKISLKVMKYIKMCDDNSFAVYIVHEMFLVGVLSVKEITVNMAVNTIIFAVLTIMSALLLNTVALRVIRRLV